MNFLEGFRKGKQPIKPDLHVVASDDQPVVTSVEDKEVQARLNALQNSYAPIYIDALRQSPDIKIVGEDWCPEIHVRNEERQVCDVFSVVGKVNGSIQIGHEILNQRIAKDHELVVDAFERAFQNAMPLEDSLEHNHKLHIVS